jgi:hypothetical protein
MGGESSKASGEIYRQEEKEEDDDEEVCEY